MVDAFKDYYQMDKNMLDKVEIFRMTYTSEKAIECYTDEGFLYKQLNKALRTKDIESLYIFRFFIIDLCAAIEQKYLKMKDNETLMLYRGQQLSKEEFDSINNNVDKVIVINGFFSTSRDQKVALMFAGQCHPSSTMRSVLFEIEANSFTSAVKFADVADVSRFKEEREILFNLNALFQIVAVQFDQTLNVWKVRMVTSNNGPDRGREYRSSVDERLLEHSPIIYFGRLIFCGFGRPDLARQYFNTLLKTLSDNHPDIASIYNNLGHIDYDMGDLNLASKNYELAYDIRQKRLPSNSPHISCSLVNIGHMHKEKGLLDRAIECYRAAANIDNQNYCRNHVRKGTTNESIGLVYIAKKDFDTALIYLLRALDIYQSVLPAEHHDIAECLGNIGVTYENMCNLPTALDYYQRQLKMEEACLPFDHSRLCQHANWIVQIYAKMGDADAALMFCQRRLDSQKSRLGDHHSHVARVLTMMGSVLENRDLEKASAYYREALSIVQCSPITDHQTTFECLTAIGSWYTKCGMFREASEIYLEAVNLKRRVGSFDNLNLAYGLRNLGVSYLNMNDMAQARRCFQESLSIYLANYESKNERVQLLLADIAGLDGK